MLKYIDETDYIELLGAESIPNDFNKLNIDASTYINMATQGRIKEVTEEVKYCTCRLIELLQEESKINPNVKSQSVDGWSETYEETPQVFNDKKKIELIERLLPANLTYRGIGYDI